MWRDKGRSGIGDAFIGTDTDSSFVDGHTYEGWVGLSPNGRQGKNPLTDEVRDLSGANYWHLRKENFPNNSVAAITAESFSTPSYYHAKRKELPTSVDVVKTSHRASESVTEASTDIKVPSFWQEVLKGCRDGNVFKKWFYKGE